MSLSLKEVEHIAALAHLALSAKEKETFREQLSQTLDYFEHLQAVGTHDIPPTSTVVNAASRLRNDDPRHGLETEELLRNAAQVEDDQFRVPPVFE